MTSLRDEINDILGMDTAEEPEPAPEGDVAHAAPMTTSAVSTLPVPVQAPSMMSLREVQRLAEEFALSQAFKPARGESVSDIAVKIMLGREMGLSPALAAQNLYVVHGRATLNSGTIAAMIKKHPDYNYKVRDHSKDACTVAIYEKWDDQWEEIGAATFTIADAKQAGLVKSGGAWTSYPQNMVFARALTNAARWYAPDVFGGPIYTPDEIEGEFRVIDDGAGGIAAAPDQPHSVSKPAAREDAPKPEPTALSRTPWDESMHTAKVADLRNEMCPEHGIEFFKKGKMKGHAHTFSLGNGDEWCNWMDVFKSLGALAATEFNRLGLDTPDEREAFTVSKFPDMDGAKPSRYRIQDMDALVAVLKETPVQETVNTDTGEVTEEPAEAEFREIKDEPATELEETLDF